MTHIYFKSMTKVFITTLIICLLTCILYEPLTALADINATSKIHIYNQNSYTSYTIDGYDLHTYTGTVKKTLKDNGCCTFTFAHAVQWLEGKDYSSSSEYNKVLYTLLQKSRYPSTGGYTQYSNYLTGTLKHEKVTTITKTSAWMNSFFNQGGVIVTHLKWQKSTNDSDGGGHYLLAVGCIDRDGVTYIHMVDSSSATTVKRVKSYNYSSFSVTTSLSGAGQYWIPLSSFTGSYVSYNGRSARIWFENAYLPANKIEVIKIEFDQNNISLNLTETAYINAVIYPTEASSSIIWKSSDESVATVSNDGTVRPLSIGEAIITATSASNSSIKATCKVTTYYQGTDTLKFNDILCPQTYNYNDGGYHWWYADGSITSDVSITNVTINLYNSSGAIVSTKNAAPNTKDVHLNAYDNDIKMSSLKSAGTAMLEVIAEDASGRKLSAVSYINVVSSGTTDRSHTFSCSYSYPKSVATKIYDGKRYELFESSYTWTEAKVYAESLGGQLACITSSEENTAIYELCQTVAAQRTWLGAYYDGSNYVWLSGEPMGYINWDSKEPSRSLNLEKYGCINDSGKWNDVPNGAIHYYFVVEYDQKMVQQVLLTGETLPIAGDTFTVTATVLPSDAYDPSIIFSSSAPEIASVDPQTGLVTAISEGFATITATAQDGSDVIGSYDLIVQRKPIHVTNIQIHAEAIYTDTDTITLNEGETAFLWCDVWPNDADDQSIYYYTTNDSIAYVQDYSNVVVASSAGTCEIIAVSNDNEAITSFLTLIVKEKLSVMTSPDFILPFALQTIEEEAFAGISGRLVKLPESVTSIGSRAFAECVSLEQIYIPKSVTSISEDAFEDSGKFTIVGYLNSAAQRYADSHDDISFVALDQPEPEEEPMSISISGNTTVDVGKTTALTAQITPTSLPNRTVTWASSNPSVASVSSNGTVTGLAVGTAFITAISNYDPAYTAYVIITVNPTQTVPTESDWVPASEAPAGATITQTSWSYRESTESTASTMSGWVQDNAYWHQTGTGSANYATFPSGYSTSNTYYKTFAKAPYTASNDGSTKREVTNAKAGYIYWHWMYSTVYASGTERRISSKTGYYNASGASGSGSEYYGYQYFYAIASAVDCPYLSNGYCCGANLPSYNCKSIIPSNADKSNTSGLGTDRFFRFEYYTSTYTDYQMIYEYHRDLEYQSTDPGNGDNISNKVEYVKYLIQ